MDAFADLPRRMLASRELMGAGAEELTTGQVAAYAVASAALVMGSGMASGLTLGLMSLDRLEMEVLLRSGTAREKELAARILPVLKDQHWLLVTLLLCNAACFEALPICLDVLVSPVGAILISVTLILLFGEILPQAVCVRYGLAIGARTSWIVQAFMWLLCPIAWPLARGLDFLLGKEGYNVFKRKQLKTLIDLHGADEGLGGKLTDDEVQIICGALDLTSKIAFSAMTGLDNVLMLPIDTVLDQEVVNRILASGHSRIPVYRGKRSEIVGLLLVKELLQYVFEHAVETAARQVTVANLRLRTLPRLSATTPMYDMLKLFQTGRAHMAVLTQPEPLDGAPAPTSPSPQPPPPQPSKALPFALPLAAVPNPQALPRKSNVMKAPLADGVPATATAPPGPPTPDPGAGSGVELSPVLRSSAVAVSLDKAASKGAGNGAAQGKEAASGGAEGEPGSKHRHKRKQKGGADVSTGSGEGTLAKISARLTRKRRDSGSSSSSSSEGTSEGEDHEPTVEVPELAKPGEPIGIITIEDVIEELMGQEILDETDHFADNERTVPINDEMRAKMAGALPDRIKHVLMAAGVMQNSSGRGLRRISGSVPAYPGHGHPPPSSNASAAGRLTTASSGALSLHSDAPLPEVSVDVVPHPAGR